MLGKSLVAAGFCALTSLVLVSSAAAQTGHTATFSLPRVDVLADGKVVINLEASGPELRGLVTLNLTPDGGGYKGEWMLSVRYVDNTDPATGQEPPNHEHETVDDHEHALSAAADAEHEHRDFVRLIDKGVVGGSVDSASVSFGADGAFDFTAALKITMGTLTFDGVKGTGSADMANGLSLIF